MYSIRRVETTEDNEARYELKVLHKLTFYDEAPMPDFSLGTWWLAFVDGQKEGVAFGGIQQSNWFSNGGYLCRSGVLPAHRGNRLQSRLLRTRESYAKRIGWQQVITDTTADNIASANNLIRNGYLMFAPKFPWGLTCSIYFKKVIQ